jgi:hypothetical protein
MSQYTLILLWWNPKDKKVHEKKWNKDDVYKARQFVDKVTTGGSVSVAEFTVDEVTGTYAGAW